MEDFLTELKEAASDNRREEAKKAARAGMKGKRHGKR
jgi:hypothetical protein